MSKIRLASWSQGRQAPASNFGKTTQVRRALYDLQGHVAELLSKCAATPGMDLPIAPADLEKFQEMLANFGALTKTESAQWNAYIPPGASGPG